jgi:hypothetical protein
MDTGTSSHMSNTPGNYPTSKHVSFPASITVGNGAQLPVTHVVATTIPTFSSPLSLDDILISLAIVKNLISVRQLTRDNNVSIEFDPTGFSVKDLPIRTVRLRCESDDTLYPLHLMQQHALSTSSNVDLWHARLGHPGTHTLRKFFISLISLIINLRCIPDIPAELARVYASPFHLLLAAHIPFSVDSC